MTTPETLTWDLSPAHRPSLDELGGGAKIQREPYPNPKTQLTAPDVNQWAMQIAALGRVAPLAILSVRRENMHQMDVSFISPGTKLSSESFIATRQATGDMTISWDEGALPTTTQPVACLNGATLGLIVAEGSEHSVRIQTALANGSAADLSFTVMLF